MRPLIALVLCLAAAPAAAQVRPYGPAAYATTGDLHRYEMDRLRARADASESLARSLALDARLTLLELQARRRSTPVSFPEVAVFPAPDLAQSMRQAATVRREAIAAGVGQIDAWLDRAPQ